MEDKIFLENIIKGIVKYPDDVEINRTVDEDGVLLKLKVHRADMGLVIGRKGEHAGSIKLLVKLMGMKGDLRISLKIEEPNK